MLECFICFLAHGAFSCVSIIPLWPWGTTSFDAVSGSGTYVRTPSLRCSMCLIEWSVLNSAEVARSEVEMGWVNGSEMCAAIVCSVGSADWRVRRSSAANWGDRAMWEGCAGQWRAGGRLLLPLKGWVGGHEMSMTLRVMYLLWQGHRFVHWSLCLVLVDVNDLKLFSNKRSCQVQWWWHRLFGRVPGDWPGLLLAVLNPYRLHPAKWQVKLRRA